VCGDQPKGTFPGASDQGVLRCREVILGREQKMIDRQISPLPLPLLFRLTASKPLSQMDRNVFVTVPSDEAYNIGIKA
jgi:hypothetical protein